MSNEVSSVENCDNSFDECRCPSVKKRKALLSSGENISCHESVSSSASSASLATRRQQPKAYSNKKQGRKQDGCKANKGLRHFSMQVCKKVEEKGLTSYNEVADELVQEFFLEQDKLQSKINASDASASKCKAQIYDEKNIRRRVYDALNVLMAMDIIEKDKKEIRWKGLPHRSNKETESLHHERAQRIQKVKRKRESLKELVVQNICFTNLVNRNRSRYQHQQKPPESVSLPFIVANTSNQTSINCEINPDRTDVFFQFSNSFEINDDNKILKRLQLHRMDENELRRILKPQLYDYCSKFGLLKDCIEPSFVPCAKSNSVPMYCNEPPIVHDSSQRPTVEMERRQRYPNEQPRLMHHSQPVSSMHLNNQRSNPAMQRSYPPFYNTRCSVPISANRYNSNNDKQLSSMSSVRYC